MEQLPPCPLCGREMIEGSSVDRHHLIPKLKGGKEMVLMHKICHQKIHSVYTESELKNYFHTIERLKESPEIQAFIKWVQKKAPEFYASHNENSRRRRR